MKRKSRKNAKIKKVLIIFSLIFGGLSIFFFYEYIFDIFRSKEKKEVSLYFSDSEGEYLVAEKRKIMKRAELKDEIKEIIKELIKGPKGKLIPTIPPRTELLDVELSLDGVAKLNFNKRLTRDHPGGSSAELMTIYSIVNSLSLNLPQIKKVQILIDGKKIDTIAGHLSLRESVSPKSNLIRW